MGAQDRQYTKAQSAVRICDYIRQHRTLTMQEAMDLTGRGYFATYYLLIELDEILGMYTERGGRGVLRRRLIEDDRG